LTTTAACLPENTSRPGRREEAILEKLSNWQLAIDQTANSETAMDLRPSTKKTVGCQKSRVSSEKVGYPAGKDTKAHLDR